jgi:DNA-binding LacI/PurR family transcriptional regulator
MSYLRDKNVIDIRGTRGAFIKKKIDVREKYDNIAVIHKFIGDPAGFYANAIIEDYARANDFGLLSLSVAGISQYEPSLYTKLDADGFIFTHCSLTEECAWALHNAKIPFVSFNRLDCDCVSWVDYDNESDFAEVLDFLLETGSTRIAYLDFKVDYGKTQANLRKIYKRKMTDAGIYNEELFIAKYTKPEMRRKFGISFIEKAGKIIAEELLSMPELPDAILIQHGIIYEALIDECARHGVDLKNKARLVVNFEDAFDYPRDVFVMLCPYKDKVRLGFNLLHDYITTRNLKRKTILLNRKFIKPV